MWRVCVVLWILAHAWVQTSLAQPAAYSINGTVRSEADRTPLAGATVELSSARFTRRLRTDEGGRFRFGTVPVGTYRLSVLRLGYAPLSRQVSVVDADAELDVTLIPDARTLGAIVTQANVTAVFGGIGAAGLTRNAAGERPLDIARGARVQVLGSGAETETDSTGRFFLEVKKPGTLSRARDGPRPRPAGVLGGRAAQQSRGCLAVARFGACDGGRAS